MALDIIVYYFIFILDRTKATKAKDEGDKTQGKTTSISRSLGAGIGRRFKNRTRKTCSYVKRGATINIISNDLGINDGYKDSDKIVLICGTNDLANSTLGKTIISYDKCNESGFRPPLCTYRLNWARRTSWGWWDDWDDTVLQTQDSKFKPWRSEAEHATSRSRRLPTILTFTRGWGRKIDKELNPELWRARQRC